MPVGLACLGRARPVGLFGVDFDMTTASGLRRHDFECRRGSPTGSAEDVTVTCGRTVQRSYIGIAGHCVWRASGRDHSVRLKITV